MVLAIAGYAGAALTAFYAFRMVFRVFWGNPVEEARELEQGHLAHHPPANPATGEAEDTDVGFPAEEHHIAEREWPMRAAMGPLAVLALLAGFVQVPGVTDMIEKFLEPTFADSHFHEAAPSDSAEWVGLVVGGLISLGGITAAYFAYVRRRGVTLELRDRFGRVHAFLVNKWYFDELFEAVFVRPVATAGGFRPRRDRDPLRAGLPGGRRDRRRAGRDRLRALDPDRLPARLRAAAAVRRGPARPLLPAGQLVTIHLSIVLFLPLATGLLGAFLPREMARWAVLAGTSRCCSTRSRCWSTSTPAAGSST